MRGAPAGVVTDPVADPEVLLVGLVAGDRGRAPGWAQLFGRGGGLAAGIARDPLVRVPGSISSGPAQ